MNNDFSLPFCQLKLQLLFNAKAGVEVRNDIVDVMFKAAVEDSRSKRSHWLGLVNLMSHDAARQVRPQFQTFPKLYVLTLIDSRTSGKQLLLCPTI
jgi:mediator of RNA polymerase II transcription subunit 12